MKSADPHLIAVVIGVVVAAGFDTIFQHTIGNTWQPVFTVVEEPRKTPKKTHQQTAKQTASFFIYHVGRI